MHPGKSGGRVSPPQGFTLLEITVSMFIFAMLIVSIFGIVSSTTQLADEMQREHEHDAQSHAFSAFCGRVMRNLPAQAQVRLRVKQAGRNYLGQLAILNAPPVFGAAAGGPSSLTIIESEEQPDGYLRVLLHLVRAEDITAYEAGQGDLGQRLPLLEDVAHCEWKVFNAVSNQWEPLWNDKLLFASPPAIGNAAPPLANSTTPGPVLPVGTPASPRPALVELTLSLHAEPPRRFVFWVPPAQVPLSSSMSPPTAP